MAEASVTTLGSSWGYRCPVCDTELARSNFETPPTDYYCPVCTTRQLPSRYALSQPGLRQTLLPGSLGDPGSRRARS